MATAPNGAVLPRYHMAMPQAGTDGDVEEMALYAGQGVGLVTRGCAGRRHRPRAPRRSPAPARLSMSIAPSLRTDCTLRR